MDFFLGSTASGQINVKLTSMFCYLNPLALIKIQYHLSINYALWEDRDFHTLLTKIPKVRFSLLVYVSKSSQLYVYSAESQLSYLKALFKSNKDTLTLYTCLLEINKFANSAGALSFCLLYLYSYPPTLAPSSPLFSLSPPSEGGCRLILDLSMHTPPT